MKKPAIFCFIILLCTLNSLRAETITLTATAPIGGSATSQTLTIQTNQVATVLHVYVPPEADPSGEEVRIPFVFVKIGTNQFGYKGFDAVKSQAPVKVSGPAEISLFIANTNESYETPVSTFCTVEIKDNQPQFSPSTAVVIPTDATGPVRIVLESSPELLNWSDALPGTYGSSTTNRFFRVRAVRQ